MDTLTSAEPQSSPDRPAPRREPAHRLTSPRWRRPQVRPVALVAAVTLVASVLLTAVIAGMGAFGYRALVIRSGSMTPALHTGDLVISRSELASRIRPGDVITFHPPSGQGELVTHRAVSLTRAPGVINVVTKGDANQVTESWSVGASGQVGLAVGHLRFVGWWFAAFESGAGRIVLVCAACLWLAAVVVPRIWASS